MSPRSSISIYSSLATSSSGYLPRPTSASGSQRSDPLTEIAVVSLAEVLVAADFQVYLTPRRYLGNQGFHFLAQPNNDFLGDDELFEAYRQHLLVLKTHELPHNAPRIQTPELEAFLKSTKQLGHPEISDLIYLRSDLLGEEELAAIRAQGRRIPTLLEHWEGYSRIKVTPICRIDLELVYDRILPYNV